MKPTCWFSVDCVGWASAYMRSLCRCFSRYFLEKYDYRAIALGKRMNSAKIN